MAHLPTTHTRRLYVVYNPVSGKAGASDIRQALGRAFAASEGAEAEPVEASCEFHEVQPGEDLAGLARGVAGQGGYDLVVAAGGDGTVSGVANGLAGTPTPLGILPLGTTNVLARELGIPVELDEACRLVAGEYAVRAIDAMRVGQTHYFTQLGAGIDALMIRETRPEAKRRFGRLAYAWSAFTHLLGFQPRRFAVTCDGRSIRTRASQVLVANCGLLGQPPFRWGPDIRADDGRVDVCIVRARTLVDYLVLAWFVARGQHRRSPNVRYKTALHRVAIATRRPLPVQADGEIIGETPVEVEVVPATLRVAVPTR